METNATNIERAILVTLPPEHIPTEAEIAALVDKLSAVFPINDADREGILKRLHAKLAIHMEEGVALFENDHRPWLNARKPQIDPFYTQRYRDYLMRMQWPPQVVNTLDRVTDEILDLAGDPAREGAWRRRGLVMGEVQSGKTATYTALCCKAADAGYRLIVLLTGTLESLRRQTQERLDAGFVGLDSSGFLSPQRQSKAIGVGLIDKSRSGVVFTSRTTDFSIKLVTQLNFKLSAFHEPILLVVKKNKQILQNLQNWLGDYNAEGGKIAMPLLLIDDEADNASVNTRAPDQDPTAINERIRALLGLFRSSSYVGFTATPFANIFIDPDTVDDMVGDDLFPRDFIYALEPPNNYVGPTAIFGADAPPSMVNAIEDAEAIFPYGHKASHPVTALPESLHEALRCFILANAVRDCRGESNTHRSMLVNVSRFTDVQTQVAALIENAMRDLQNDIRNYSRLPEADAMRNPSIRHLKETWDEEFSRLEFDWPMIRQALRDAALPIVVRAVNQRTGAGSLDYAPYRDTGLRVVAVGGNSLSRGLTLEGLCTSYFFRNSQMYDTLLQMGRWFGYRDSYVDVCRIWLTEDAQHWYAHITEAAEELRAEIGRMRSLNLTPSEFGLKVRAHPDALIVTARNKMRSAKTVERIISVSEQSLETPHLWFDAASLELNSRLVAEFVQNIEEAGIVRGYSRHGKGENSLWSLVPKRFVAQLLRRFKIHPRNITFQGESLADLIERTAEPKLQRWDVVLPNGEENPESLFEGLQFRPQRRIVTWGRANDILVSGKSARVGSRGIEREGIDVAAVKVAEEDFRRNKPGSKSIPDHVYRLIRPRPLLLLHIIRPMEDGNPDPLDTFGQRVCALGLSFPHFDDSDERRRVSYKVNLVEWRSLFEEEADDEQEEGDGAT